MNKPSVCPELVEGLPFTEARKSALRQAQGERDFGNASLRFAGYAAIFDRPDRSGDVIRAGAFTRTLADHRQIPLLWQHQRGHIIGRIETLEEDKRGLRVIARIDDAAVRVRLAAGSGLSFGYRVRQGRQADGLRELGDLDLVEVSIVTIPMQSLARVHMLDV